jgi:NAD(P) transhydrogenase subunit alpha
VERAAIEAMKPGSVVVDLAAESGGNVDGSRPGQEVMVGSALVWGARNVASEMPVHASRLYAANVVELLLLMTRDGRVEPDFGDEILDNTCVTHDGVVRHGYTSDLLGEVG